MYPEVEQYFAALKAAETKVPTMPELGERHSEQNCRMCAVEAAAKVSWPALKGAANPLVRWIAENCGDYRDEAETILRALPAPLAVLDEIAASEGWCGAWGGFRRQAEEAGVLPAEIDYAARVAKGIALMDAKWPNWAQDIDLERLNIASGTRCMTAQYAQLQGEGGNWRAGKTMLGLSLFEYEEHGFKADDADEHTAYPTLNALWRAEIERRRAQAQGAPAEPETAS